MIVGVEYHRQLSTDKLFCPCRTNSKPHDTSFTNCIGTYWTNESYCQYEQQQIPPVLRTRLLRKALRCLANIKEVRIHPNVKFCRKHIGDGSLPSGYQITGIIADGGYVSVGSKKVFIDKIALEQDSGRLTPKGYLVDRLGVPLLEITTKPMELTSGQVVMLLKELESLLDWDCSLPITNSCRRQDINLSVAGHPKVEYKGVDSLSSIVQIMSIQELRQLSNIKDGTCESTTRIIRDGLSIGLRGSQDDSRMHPETDLPVINLTPYKVTNSSRDNFRFKNSAQRNLYIKLKKYDINNQQKRLLATKSKNRFMMYMKGKLSLYSLIRDRDDKTLDPTTLDELYQKNPLLFYKNYKMSIPRKYRPNDPNRNP